MDWGGSRNTFRHASIGLTVCKMQMADSATSRGGTHVFTVRITLSKLCRYSLAILFQRFPVKTFPCRWKTLFPREYITFSKPSIKHRPEAREWSTRWLTSDFTLLV